MVKMELASTNLTNAEDHLIRILTQIKQYNENVKDLLEGSHLKNNEDLEKCICSLIFLIHDLSRTFCDKLSRTTESLQSTLHLLNGIQSKFQDMGSNNEHINNLILVHQILGDTTKQLKLTEQQLKDISNRYKDTADRTQETSGIDKVTNDDVDGNRSVSVITGTSQVSEVTEKTRVEKSTTQDVVYETDKTLVFTNEPPTINNNSDGEESKHYEVNRADTSIYKEQEEEDVNEKNGKLQQDLNERPSHTGEYGSADSDKENKAAASDETTLNPSIQYVGEAENWTYKEYMLQPEDGNDQRLACFIKAPPVILEQLQCQCMDDISSLVVFESEELVSSVLGIWSKDPDLKIPFPLSISIPFNARYRGHYKDVMVKANDEKLQSSYILPNSLDGYHGSHKGSFAEFKVYKLGIFSVVSCLKKENFTVPKKGLSLKLSVDPRISVNYPPGCFNTSVIVQSKVQPIDTSLFTLLKVKHDIYHSVVSSSPLVHMKHPSVQLFQKPVTIFLPCPPNPEKRKQGDDLENKRPSTATVPRVTAANPIRAVSASMKKHKDNPTEILKLLAFKEDQWHILDDIVVKNVQNGVVSFDVAEYLQRFIVIRLSSTMDNLHLISFIQNLENATYNSMVNVVLYRRKDNLQKAIVEVIPSKELNWEILHLRESGYMGPPEPSEQIPLQEGEQIHLRFCGNITASDGKTFGNHFKLTFHSQRKQRLPLNLSVVDEFGNYSSPHYKGTVTIYKLSKEDIIEGYKSGLETDMLLQQCSPVCKLALTLPKKEKNFSRPSTTKLTTSDPTDLLWDNLLHWLAQELSEEDASLLVLSLPIRRSTIQLVKLKSPDNLTDQIYELLNYWKKSLPTSADKLRLLARHLRKSGRSDLLEQLQVRWEDKTTTPTVS
ncbi:death domain-containing protein 1 [Spea bombifrons]|uniref:death domain-containing protein 1 n=1 Tax=Spea bombifrons TaxID=233779 RepID=UPI00234A4EF0|nr:death domain-containing protein 1 [Spea bombifrons]